MKEDNLYLCNNTIKHILKDCEERLKILGDRKQTPITLGRINEMQCLIVHLQQIILDNMQISALKE